MPHSRREPSLEQRNDAGHARTQGLEGGAALLLRQEQHLIGNDPGWLQLAAIDVKCEEPLQWTEQLRCLTDLVAQLPRPTIGASHFRRRQPLGGYLRKAQ